MSFSSIRFETICLEDRNASLSAGHYVPIEKDIAFLSPIGGNQNLIVEKEVTEDLLKTWRTQPQERYKYDAYMAWKENSDAPVNGFPLKEWPPISKPMLEGLNKVNIRSVEEFAELPDSVLINLGPGIRPLRDKAREWLKVASTTGRTTEEIQALKIEAEALKVENQRLQASIDKLKESKNIPEETESPKSVRKS